MSRARIGTAQKSDIMTLLNSRERQIMQRLKCGLGQSHEYAGQPKDDCKMIGKGWVGCTIRKEVANIVSPSRDFRQ